MQPFYATQDELIDDFLKSDYQEAVSDTLRLLGYDPDSLTSRRDGLVKLKNLVDVRILELEMMLDETDPA